ncbi:MAG: GNAT family N-acetyltransferase [Rhodospirillales bacterium]|nr:GNAT family N-acetyltransferase [Rhodospirillales bacterium]
MHDTAASIVWQPLQEADMDAVGAIAAQVHPALPERLEVLAEKQRLFPAGCRKLMVEEAICGYALAHPWLLAGPPALDAFLGGLPATPDCLFVHDVAVLPEARGHGAGAAFMAEAEAVAVARGWPAIGLVAAYGTARLWRRFGFQETGELIPPDKLAAYGAQACYLIRRLGRGPGGIAAAGFSRPAS